MSTKLPNPETEKKFKEYRQYLTTEAIRLASYVALYRKLYERRVDRLEEMNIAPAFFEVVTDALLAAIFLWVDKLFDEDGERSIFNFLTFVEQNRKHIGIKHLITLETIKQDRERIRSLECLKNFKTLRDKFYAHFDKDFFFDRERMRNEAPTWGDLKKVAEVTSDVLSNYSRAYDGQHFKLEIDNIDDLDYLLDRLHKCKKVKNT